MNKQTTDTILMIEPVAFYYNPQTAVNNFFQEKPDESRDEIQQAALKEFSQMVQKLRDKNIEVITIKDTLEPHTPDSIFPNNWVSTHANGKVVFYPMFAVNRRAERREDILDVLEEKGFVISDIMDYTSAERNQIFLEGTGSIILDSQNAIAYAAISPRTDEKLFIEFCEELDFTPVAFTSNQTVDGKRMPIYHTNVMMSIAEKYAIICTETIDDPAELKYVTQTIQNSGKEIIEITEAQIHQFAGNMLQVSNKDDEKFMVMSKSAYDSLTKEQIEKIERYNEIISVEIPTIETLGGGSARCMMAEVFLPKAN